VQSRISALWDVIPCQWEMAPDTCNENVAYVLKGSGSKEHSIISQKTGIQGFFNN
jgi:hypothetical protein